MSFRLMFPFLSGSIWPCLSQRTPHGSIDLPRAPCTLNAWRNDWRLQLALSRPFTLAFSHPGSLNSLCECVLVFFFKYHLREAKLRSTYWTVLLIDLIWKQNWESSVLKEVIPSNNSPEHLEETLLYSTRNDLLEKGTQHAEWVPLLSMGIK